MLDKEWSERVSIISVYPENARHEEISRIALELLKLHATVQPLQRKVSALVAALSVTEDHMISGEDH